MSSTTKRRQKSSAAKSSGGKSTSGEGSAPSSGSKSKGVESPPEPLTTRQVIAWSLASGLLLYAAFPPLALWPLAWIAPIGWLALVAAPKLPRGAYFWIYLTAVVHWLLLLWGVGHAHWATRALGWPALSLYVAVYTPALVALARMAVHRYRIPLPWAGAIVWTALELIRGHFATGLAIALIGHTQHVWLGLIQVAELVGGYGLGFLLLLVAGVITQMALAKNLLPGFKTAKRADKPVWLPHAMAATLLLAATLVYGYARISGLTAAEMAAADQPKTRIALVQSAIDTSFDDPTQSQRTFEENFALTDQWVRSQVAKGEPLADLIVWPESSMGGYMWPEIASDFAPPPEIAASRPHFDQDLLQHQQGVRGLLHSMSVQHFQSPLLVGISAALYGNEKVESFNTALFTNAEGEVAARYSKMHPVMFGEYVPGGQWFPWLYEMTPMGGGLTPGTEPLAIPIGEVTVVPNICFENTVPHLIRRQLRTLAAQGHSPDVLITLTNDGWFWGSSILDLHLTCGQFRAIENRRPMLIAANTGLTAEISPTGQIRQQGPRRETAVLVAEVGKNRHFSLYTLAGDWFAAICLTATLGMLVVRFTHKCRSVAN
ncbi:MAG: apolipoprotein N-acyltransferase [Pirellulaceae bacterium]